MNWHRCIYIVDKMNKKILLMSSSIPTMLLFRRDIIEILAEEWYEVHIIWDRNLCNHGIDFKLHDNIKLHHQTSLKIANPLILFDILKQIRLIKSINAELIILFEAKSIFTWTISNYICNTLWWENSNVIWFLPGLWRVRLFNTFQRAITKKVFKKLDTLVCLNNSDRLFMSNMHLDPTIFPTEYMSPLYHNEVWFKIEKYSRQERKIYYIWRFAKWKWIENLCEAIKIFNKKNEDQMISFHFVWYWEKEIERMVIELANNNKNVSYYWKKDPRTIHSILEEDVHCLILASESEWSPTVIREALSSWSNIITTTNPWCDQFFYTKEWKRVAYSCGKWSANEIYESFLHYLTGFNNHSNRAINWLTLMSERFSNDRVTESRRKLLANHWLQIKSN